MEKDCVFACNPAAKVQQAPVNAQLYVPATQLASISSALMLSEASVKYTRYTHSFVSADGVHIIPDNHLH